jgi:hypothetical protein
MIDDLDSKRTPPADAECGATGPDRTTPDAATTRPPSVAKPKLPDPTSVLDDASLSRDEKIEKLRRWATDARRVEASNDDGLQGAVTPSNLPAIQAALRQLGACEDPAAEQPGINV